MNRILFEKSEIHDGIAVFGGERAEHVMAVLHGEVGQTLKTGEIDGPIGTGEILEISGAAGSPSLQLKVRVKHDERSLEPWVDLILAPPRPRVLKRLLPQLATMGAGRIILVGAKKVEKDFWGATLLKEENYRPLLVDGLMQGGTSILPRIEGWKSFNRFLREGLPSLAHTRRLVAHPYESSNSDSSICRFVDSSIRNGLNPPCPNSNSSRLLLAIGPEGGWTDEEVESLEAAGFTRYSLGHRILRTDTATIALLARLMD